LEVLGDPISDVPVVDKRAGVGELSSSYAADCT
jgi:hypothetical protein